MSCNAKKDPNGTWRIQYRWTDWTGAKKKSQKRGFKTKKEAEEWYAHFLLQQSSDPTMTLSSNVQYGLSSALLFPMLPAFRHGLERKS